MKELNYYQMEQVTGGKILACVSQVAGGIGVLGFVAAIGIYATTPLGWGLFAISAISLVAGVASDPTACD
jgi:hypothetical protein